MICKPISEIFNFISSEKIIASDLQIGDIALLHSRWLVVVKTELFDNGWNHGRNFSVTSLEGGGSYFSPSENVFIIKRGLVDKDGIVTYIHNHLKEVEEYDRIREEEEKEELEREKEYLRERLEALGD